MSKRRPSSATVIACVALFFAIAGGSAIALKGKNTVDSGDIKKGQVKTSDIANNAVTTKKIKGNAVRTSDVQNGQIRAADLAPSEPFHIVTPTQFNNGGEGDCQWSSADSQAPDFGSTAFFKDNLGIVHLRGLVLSTEVPAAGDGQCDTSGGDPETLEDNRIFTLPAGYAPPQLETFAVTNTTDPEFVFITPEGGAQLGPTFLPSRVVIVNFGGPEAVPLGGITFRAAGPGVGLPRRTPAEAPGSSPPGRGLLPGLG
jgi:hypothetical protein